MRTTRRTGLTSLQALISLLFLSVLLAGCSAVNTLASGSSHRTPDTLQAASPEEGACPVSEPVLLKPPDDAAVLSSPSPGYYFVNEDRSIWASSWWTEAEESHWRAGEEGNKVGWFRPEGATLEITGRRLDAQAPALESHVPCCYPTRFQATGLIFPTEGCWEVTARAEDSLLTFVVRVEPETGSKNSP